MLKKRSPKEIIESKDSEIEHAFMKYPAKKMIYASEPNLSDKYCAAQKRYKIREIEKREKYRTYSHIHTHPDMAIPSGEDLKNFMEADRRKSMVIADRDCETGEVKGYYVIRKTDKTPTLDVAYNFDGPILGRLWEVLKEEFRKGKLRGEVGRDARVYGQYAKDYGWEDFQLTTDALKEFLNKYHLKSRMVPAKDFSANLKEMSFERKSLEQKLSATVSIIAILSGAFFFSTKITGNVIAISTKTSSLIGIALFLVGIIGAFFWLKSKNK